MKNKSILPIAAFIFSFSILLTRSSQSQNTLPQVPKGEQVKVIELRNYMLRPGKRDSFIIGFEDKILDTLNGRGNYVLGQYRVKGAEDNFLWIRGFNDMPSRLNALKGFYSCKYWQEVVWIPQAYILNYTNVNLLKPLSFPGKNKNNSTGFSSDWFGKPKGITVVDYYYATNGWLDRLIDFMQTKYDPVLQASNVENISYWISEQAINEYIDLPVYQDKNLLVTISFYENEEAYKNTLKKINATMSGETRNELLGIVTTKNSLVLYPTQKSFSVRQ
jgi:hypothetical protein